MKRRSIGLISLFAILLTIGLFVLTSAAQARCYTYTTLDDPNYVGSTYPIGINNNGDIAGFCMDYMSPPCSGGLCPNIIVENNHGFLYTDGVYTTLEYPGAQPDATLSGINDSGDIVGFSSALNSNGFLYKGGSFTTLSGPTGTTWIYPTGINDNGVIAGYYFDNSGVHGFSYNGSTYTALDDPSGVGKTYPLGISDNGDIVGYYYDNQGVHGFLYNGSTYTTLDDPNGVGKTYASGINDSGDIVGYYYDGGGDCHGFIYDGTSYTTLDAPSGVEGTFANGINNGGDIVGYYHDGGGVHGFLAVQVPLWQDATATGGGWYHLGPFGSFYPNPSSWIYHQSLGWLYPVGTSTDSIWFYDPQWNNGQGGWWWTSAKVFPWVYSAADQTWLYYEEWTNPPQFYNFKTNK